jgi:hypothetical protein
MQSSLQPNLLRHLSAGVVAAAVLACSAAQAEVKLTAGPNFAGDYADIVYGQGGNLFELQPYLFINGLGSADYAKGVTSRNPALAFSWATQQVNANLLVVEYKVSNLSALESFEQLRLMVYANPDGDSTQYLDTVSQTWGAAAVGDAVRREVIALPALDSVISGFKLNNALTDGAPAGGCVSASGCDASWGLQWNAATLKPGESFVVRVGLSDNGQALSGRFLTATAVNNIDTAITISGLGQIAAVPEPSTWALWLCGLMGLHRWTRRR